MEIEKLLPIGSVLRLNNEKKRLMVFGVMQTGSTEQGETEAEYIGVPYPEGNMGPQYQYLFHHKDIEEVIFRGFEDEERDAFIENLSEIYAERQNA